MKNKQFIAGFLTCAILLSAIFITGSAEGFTALLNPYPITFNGQPAQVEAYNINGSTYLRLGDVAKYFNATAMLNGTTKQIEINTNESEVTSMSTATAAIEYDTTTKLPIGAEVVEYKGCKDAVRYNGGVYISFGDLASAFGIRSKQIDVKSGIRVFEKDQAYVNVDLNAVDGHFLNSTGESYYNVNLFSSLIGE